LDPKIDKSKKEEILKDPSVKEMDLAQISEKEVFVRQANLVSVYTSLIYKFRMILRRVLITASQQCISAF
jgi:hypothetical protein